MHVPVCKYASIQVCVCKYVLQTYLAPFGHFPTFLMVSQVVVQASASRSKILGSRRSPC